MTARIPFKLTFAFLLTWTFVLVYGLPPNRPARCLSARAALQGNAENSSPPTANSGLTLPLAMGVTAEIAHLRVAIDQTPHAGTVTDVLERLPGFGPWRVIEEDLSGTHAQTLGRLERAVSGEEASRLMLHLLSSGPLPLHDTWEVFEDLLDFHVLQPEAEGAVLQAGLARMADSAPLERIASWYERLKTWEEIACDASEPSTARPTSVRASHQSALCDRAPEVGVQLEPFLVAANLVNAASWRSEMKATARRCAANTEGLIADALVGEARWTGTAWHWYGWRVEYNQILAVVDHESTGETFAVGPGARNRYPLAPLEQELVACMERGSKSTTGFAPANQELDLVIARSPRASSPNKNLAAVKLKRLD